jgi:TonB-dependent receptor-like protein
LNEARVNFTRFSFNQLTASAATNFGLPRIEIEALPFDRIRFGPPWGETTPGIFAENTYAFRDNISKVAGNHVFRFGVDVTKEQDNNNLVGGARPLYSFTGLFNLANQTPVFEQINANPQNGQPADAQRYFRTSTYAGYMQDSWKVHPNVSVTLGVRYEYFTPLSEKRNNLNNLVFSQGTLVDAHVVPVKQLTDPQIHQFTPRFGFAWSPPWGNNKLVMRGGFGMYYNRVPDSLFANTRGNPPNFARFQLCCGTPDTPFDNGQIQFALGSSNSPSSFPVNPALAVGIDPKTGAPLGRSVEIWGAQRNFPNAYAYIYSFAIEYQLPYRLVSEIAYQGSADHHLIRIVNQNFLYPQNPNFFQVFFPQPDVNSDYNSLNLRLTRQFGQGFQLETKYRWSKSMDTLSYEGPGGSTNQTFPQDNHTERGPSDFDATHYLLVSGIYELPWYRKQEGFWGKLLGGFELSGIETAHSGFPWTPKIGQSVSTPGGPTLAPIRPTQYFGGALNDTSNDAFIRPGGNFPGGGAKFFNITASGPPGVGRNSFRGPHYVSTDLSVIKQTRLPASWHMGEAAMIDIRANLYNVFNQLNLTPFNFFSAGTFADNSTLFGRADGGLAGRVVEFQARFSF